MILWLDRMHLPSFKKTARLVATAALAALGVHCLVFGLSGKVATAASFQGQNAPDSSQKTGGDLYKQGVSLEAAGKLPEALKSYQTSCDAGEAAGCNKLGELYQDGRGTPQDDGHAFQLFQKACDAGNAVSCNHLGFMYTIGGGVEHDPIHAVQIYQEICDAGDA